MYIWLAKYSKPALKEDNLALQNFRKYCNVHHWRSYSVAIKWPFRTRSNQKTFFSKTFAVRAIEQDAVPYI